MLPRTIMKKLSKKQKLTVATETLRSLEDLQLKHIAAGLGATGDHYGYGQSCKCPQASGISCDGTC